MPWIHNPHHDITDDWKQSVSRWLHEDGEVLFVLRYAFGGGAKDYCLIRDAATLWQLVDVVPKGTDVIAIRGRWLPLRGAIDEGFIAKALQLVKNETEYMFVIDMAKAVDDPRMNGGFDIGHGMMRDDLNQHIGQLAAFGECPNFMAKDSEAMKSFSKDGWDGPR